MKKNVLCLQRQWIRLARYQGRRKSVWMDTCFIWAQTAQKCGRSGNLMMGLDLGRLELRPIPSSSPASEGCWVFFWVSVSHSVSGGMMRIKPDKIIVTQMPVPSTGVSTKLSKYSWVQRGEMSNHPSYHGCICWVLPGCWPGFTGSEWRVEQGLVPVVRALRIERKRLATISHGIPDVCAFTVQRSGIQTCLTSWPVID